MAAPPPDLVAALDSVRSEPHEVATWEDLEDIAAKHELPEHAFDLYREVLLRDDLPGAVAEQLTQRAVRFHDEWFDDPFPLAELLSRLLSRDPDAGWAFERLTLLYTAKERWDELFALYDSVLAATKDATRRRELLDEAAHAAKDLASRPDRAITYLMELAPLRPAPVRCFPPVRRRDSPRKKRRTGRVPAGCRLLPQPRLQSRFHAQRAVAQQRWRPVMPPAPQRPAWRPACPAMAAPPRIARTTTAMPRRWRPARRSGRKPRPTTLAYLHRVADFAQVCLALQVRPRSHAGR